MLSFFTDLFSASENDRKHVLGTESVRSEIIDMGFSQEMTENIIRFILTEKDGVIVKKGFDPHDVRDRKFLRFLYRMGFSDIHIAYQVYLRYRKDISWSARDDGGDESKIRCMYGLYGARTLQDMVDILKSSWLQTIRSGDTVLLVTDIIKRLTPYLVVYGSIEHLDNEINEYNDIVSRNKGAVQKILDKQKTGNGKISMERKIQRKQQLLHTHVTIGGTAFTRALWIRWHFQRIFARFDENNRKKWYADWEKELGL